MPHPNHQEKEKSDMRLIETVNTAAQTVAIDGLFNLGQIDRKVCSCQCGIPTFGFDGVRIYLNHKGYYEITATVVAESAATALSSVQIYANGIALPGAISTITAVADATATYNVTKMVRVLPNCSAVPNNSPVAITIGNDGAADLSATSVNVIVKKVE